MESMAKIRPTIHNFLSPPIHNFTHNPQSPPQQQLMASVLRSPLPLSHLRTSSSKSASTSVSSFPATHGARRSPALRRRSGDLEDDVICRTSIGEVTFIQPPESAPPKEDPIGPLKIKLLSAVSGLNRGLAATEDDLRRADDAAKELEASGGAVNIPANLDKLQGRWKLVYSSAFSSRTLGGSRPGPPTGRLLPITLGQVFQRIDIYSLDFDNIVELELGAPWPLPPLEVTATLAHKFELVGNTGIKIIFEKTTVKTTGNLSQLPALDIPQLPEALRPQTNRGNGEFEVTYLDSDMRITRGDRGELRVFVVA